MGATDSPHEPAFGPIANRSRPTGEDLRNLRLARRHLHSPSLRAGGGFRKDHVARWTGGVEFRSHRLAHRRVPVGFSTGADH